MTASIDKVKIAFWFFRRPIYWPHARERALRLLRPDHDSPKHARIARDWAAERTVSVAEALAAIGLAPPNGADVPRFPEALRAEAEARVEASGVKMGGAGDIDLLYAATLLSGARLIVETGVAYGWSSLAMLAAINDREGARLISVDMPYPRMNNEAFVGVAVPDPLPERWEVVREPDRNGLEKAIARIGGEIDLCHYDSDKSWWGRQFGYRLLWDALRPGGVFISDDIQDNLAFKELVEAKGQAFAVTHYKGKYVGILRKA